MQVLRRLDMTMFIGLCTHCAFFFKFVSRSNNSNIHCPSEFSRRDKTLCFYSQRGARLEPNLIFLTINRYFKMAKFKTFEYLKRMRYKITLFNRFYMIHMIHTKKISYYYIYIRCLNDLQSRKLSESFERKATIFFPCSSKSWD